MELDLIESEEFTIKRKLALDKGNKRSVKSEKVTSIHSSLENQCNDSSETHGEEIRIGASSKVNFSKLSAEEQRYRYINQAVKVQKLKAQIKSLIKTKGKRINQSLRKAHEKLRNAKHEVEEHRFLLDNLLKAIITKRLGPNTLGYCQICAILRDVLGLSREGSEHMLKLPEQTVNITSLEYKTYKDMMLGPEELRTIVGLPQLEEKDLGGKLRTLNLGMLSKIIKVNEAPVIS